MTLTPTANDNVTAQELRKALALVRCHYMTQPLVELYGGCMVVLKVS